MSGDATRARWPEFILFKCLITGYFDGSISGLDMSRAYFRCFQAFDAKESHWPPDTRTVLSDLFCELDATVWPDEIATWDPMELEKGKYNSTATIEVILRDALTQINSILEY